MKRTTSNINYTISTLFFVALMAAWQFIPSIFSIPKYIFPTLSNILTDVKGNVSNVLIYLQTTLIETISGFCLGSIIGFVVGVMMARSRLFTSIALPYVVASNAIPVIAIAPLIILWLGQGIVAKAVVSAFLCFFPLVINTYRGFTTYKSEFEELFQLYGASKFQFLFKFQLPNAREFIFSGLKLSATFSVVGAVVAEFIGANAGLGFGMLQASYSLNTPRLWGYILISCALGISMYLLIYITEIFIIKNKGDENK